MMLAFCETAERIAAAPRVVKQVIEGEEWNGGSALSQKGIGLWPGKHTRVAAQRHAR